MKGRLFSLVLLLVSIFTLKAQQNTPKFELIKTFDGHVGAVENIINCPDNTHFLVTDDGAYLYLRNKKSLELIKRVRAHTATINSCHFSADGTQLITASDDGKVKVWNYPALTLNFEIKAKFNRVAFAVFAGRPGGIVYGGYESGRLMSSEGLQYVEHASETSPGKHILVQRSRFYKGFAYGVTDGMLTPSRRSLLFGDGYAVFALDSRTLKKADSIPLRQIANNIAISNTHLYVWAQGQVEYFAFNEYGSQLAKPLGIIPVFEGSSSMANYSRIALTGKGYMATGNVYGQVVLLKEGAPQIIKRWKAHNGALHGLLFLNDGKLLLTGGNDGLLKVWGEPEEEEEEEPVIVPQMEEPAPPVTIEKPPLPDSVNGMAIVRVQANLAKPTTLNTRQVVEQQKMSLTAGDWELLVWDRQKVDGDSISLWINGEWFLKDHLLTATQKAYALPLAAGTYYLVLHAHNLGEVPPNTAGILLRQGRFQRVVDLKSDLSRSAMLVIEVK
jgi:WD40 repeat protein